MDEPFANLDPTLRPTMDELLDKLRQRYLLSGLLVTHDIEGAVRLADSIVGVKPTYAGPQYRLWPAKSERKAIESWMQS
jgi:ABC-type nitrate/sulfonate/bicarbonate transport system ATPase subunit